LESLNAWDLIRIFNRNDQKTTGITLCSFGLSATSQQYFSLKTNQPPAISQQYFSLRTNQHQSSATSQTNTPNCREFFRSINKEADVVKKKRGARRRKGIPLQSSTH
jgi:hypothetical protein